MESERIIGSEEIRKYWPRCIKLSRKYVGRYGAELDDLVQEGLIFVWQSLEKGIVPSEKIIQSRMRNWVRTMEYQTRYARLTSYERLQEVQHEAEERIESPDWWNRFTNGLDEPFEDD